MKNLQILLELGYKVEIELIELDYYVTASGHSLIFHASGDSTDSSCFYILGQILQEAKQNELQKV